MYLCKRQSLHVEEVEQMHTAGRTTTHGPVITLAILTTKANIG